MDVCLGRDALHDARVTLLGDEVERIARSFEPHAERKDLTLEVETESAPAEADSVYVDREALEHILSNLLSSFSRAFREEVGQSPSALASNEA